ncbi:MAG: hypothetical protein SWH61_01295 [Thermodesulfobacteriota bacterium]|nr:hypothetical protein [Thermodesulfobacteriota bacterium]
MTAEDNIQKALMTLLGDEPFVGSLAALLEQCRRQNGVTFRDVFCIAGNDAPEILLLAWDWKLLVPRQSLQCAEWDDRIMRFNPGEKYDMPNIVSFLIESAVADGIWDVETAVTDLYLHMGEPAYQKMPDLIREITRRNRNGAINAAEIHAACLKADIKDRTGTMIAILKGGGVISPKLVTASPDEKKVSPIYEVHPALFRLDIF